MAGPTWDTTFRTALADRSLTGLRVAVVLGPTYSPSLGGPAANQDIVFRNFGTNTAKAFNCLGSTCKVSGASLDPTTWTTTADQLQVEVTDEAAIRAALDAGAHRGTLMEIRVTLEGDIAASGYYRVWLGRLQQIQGRSSVGSRTSWVITAYGAEALLRNRRVQTGTTAGMTAALTGETYLFNHAGTTTTYITPLSYTVGDINLAVNDTTNFEHETGASGVIFLDDGTNSFYLTYTGRTGTTFTGLSAGGQFGTTAANMAAGGGSVVTHIVYLAGHPLDILRRVLQSTGTGTNGPWDDYPGKWGFGIPDELVDDVDIANWKTNVVDSTSFYHMLIDARVENSWSWLGEWIARVGIAIVMFEGRISVRCAQDIADTTPIRPAFNPVDGAIEKATWSLADSRNIYERVAFGVSKDAIPNPLTTNAEWSIIYTVPGGSYTIVSIPDLYNSAGSYLTTENDVRSRRWHWHCGVAERVDLNIAHRGVATLAPGDLSVMTSALVFGVLESATVGDTYASEDVIVADGPAVDWLDAQSCSVTVLRYRDETPPQ